MDGRHTENVSKLWQNKGVTADLRACRIFLARNVSERHNCPNNNSVDNLFILQVFGEINMTLPLTVPPRREFQTFMDFPLNCDLDGLASQGVHVAFLGIPYGDPYSIDEVTNDQTTRPDGHSP